MPGSAIFGVHTLLRIDEARLLRASSTDGAAVPGWVFAALVRAPCVVVRRGHCVDGNIPVGVRGRTRDQRWAGVCPVDAIQASASPWDLLELPLDAAAIRSIPAFQALHDLKQKWVGIEWHWGPAGSVGFELFAGVRTGTPASDLDIVMTVPQPISVSAARRLCADIENLGCRVDVRFETPIGGVLLADYAAGGSVLLRTSDGQNLCNDPWAVQQHKTEHAMAASR